MYLSVIAWARWELRVCVSEWSRLWKSFSASVVLMLVKKSINISWIKFSIVAFSGLLLGLYARWDDDKWGATLLYKQILSFSTPLQRCDSTVTCFLHLCVKSKLIFYNLRLLNLTLTLWLCYTCFSGFKWTAADPWKDVKTFTFMWTVKDRDDPCKHCVGQEINTQKHTSNNHRQNLQYYQNDWLLFSQSFSYII